MIADLLLGEETTNCSAMCCTERNRKAAAAYLFQLAEAVLRDDVAAFDLEWACADGALKATVDPRFG